MCPIVGLKMVTMARMNPTTAAGIVSPCIAGLPQAYPALTMVRTRTKPVLFTVPESVILPPAAAEIWFLNVEEVRAGLPDLMDRCLFIIFYLFNSDPGFSAG